MPIYITFLLRVDQPIDVLGGVGDMVIKLAVQRVLLT